MKLSNKNIKNTIILTVIICLIFALTACGSQTKPQETLDQKDQESEKVSEKQDLRKVIFALDWVPNTNHSGLLLARDKGFFAEEGLDVDLVQSDMSFIEMVATGSADLGIASQEQVLQSRASFAEVPVVSVAAILQHNTSGFASPEDRNILSPKDFVGKTYSGWGTDLELAFIDHLMETEGSRVDEVQVINMSATNFIESMNTEADFAWIYWGWDGILAKQQDYPVNFILLQDIDPNLDFYSPTIIASEKLIEEDPELIKAFLRAAKKGYELAIADPEAAVEALTAEVPELDKDFVKASQEYMNTQYIADAESWGQMTDERWNTFTKWMTDNDLLENDIEVEEAYSLEFIPR